ncbi:hypothetical protein [Brasilonema octagenarum]|uniref:Uncharacterized protein n=1 Tax=Brasilonema octagenarum UFV-OR1 TaxID=417115 RepID=A0ABX1MIV6_9CYAN|nr:hypothetical protein [Brasilonema octagenarum]NMF67351.1 hypothetical protein [Brasilonema octagenarum UFV-OR1]
MTTKGKLEPPPQTLLEPLLELREYYTALTEEYERLWRTARSQLVHVEALLSNWSGVDERDDLTAVVEMLSFAPTPSQQDSFSPQQFKNISDVEQQQAKDSELPDSESSSDIDLDDAEQQQAINSELPDSESSSDVDLDDAEQQQAIDSELPDSESSSDVDLDDVEQQQAIDSELPDDEDQHIDLDEESPDEENTVVTSPTSSPQKEIPTQNNDYSPGTDVPMLPQFQVLTRMQAIEKILRENAGSVCHIDFVVRSLFGDLEPSVFKIVKSRIQSSLTHGKEKSYWAAVPDEPGCYTLDLSLIIPANGKVKSKIIKPKKKKPFLLPKAKRASMVPEYEGKFLIDAICILLQKNSGKIFSVADVITGLYGELNAEELAEIKTAVHNELSRGHRIGRFSRVPEKTGYYTWDLSKIRRK